MIGNGRNALLSREASHTLSLHGLFDVPLSGEHSEPYDTERTPSLHTATTPGHDRGGGTALNSTPHPANSHSLATATAWSGGLAQTTSREPCCRASGSTRLSRCAGGDDSAVTKTKISAGIEAGGTVLVGTRSARASPTLSNTSFMSLAMGAASKGSS